MSAFLWVKFAGNWPLVYNIFFKKLNRSEIYVQYVQIVT